MHPLLLGSAASTSRGAALEQKDWGGNPVFAETYVLGVLASQLRHQAVSAFLRAVTGTEQCVSVFLPQAESVFLQPSGEPHWFSNEPRGLVFPILTDYRARGV